MSVKNSFEISPPGTQTVYLYGLFFLSGFSALAYQVTWQRMLGLFAGSDSISVTIVVGAFLLGLGVGSMLASRIADRLMHYRAIGYFALCELGIAIFAVASKPIFYDFLFRHMAWVGASRGVVFLATFAGLLVPTTLMGMSLPLLAKGVVRHIATAAEQIGWLYGVNTLGAAVGAFATGCFIVGAVGYQLTIFFAAAVNLTVAIGAVLLSRGLGQSCTAEMPAAATSQPEPVRVWAWCCLVFVSGFIIISLELLWFRSVGIMLRSTAYTFALVVGWFLLGDAVGMVAGARIVGRVGNPLRFFLLLQGAIVVYAIVALWLMDIALGFRETAVMIGTPIEAFFNAFWGAPAPTVADIAAVLTTVGYIVFPSAFLAGLSIPMAQKAIQKDLAVVGSRVGLIQVANILGNTAGSFVTGLVALQYLGLTGSLRLLALLGIPFVAGAGLITSKSVDRRRLYGTAAVIAALVIVIVTFPNNTIFWDHWLPSRDGDRAIVGEDRSGVAVMKYVTATDGYLYLGGKVQSRVPFGTSHMLLGILGPLVHPDAKSVLVVGLGSGGTAYAAGAVPTVKHVRIIEIIAPLYRVMERFAALGGGLGVDGPLSDPRYVRDVADARHALFTDPQRYDVVEADPLSPHDSYSGFLYSYEYFRQVRERLNPGGICVQWTPIYRIGNAFLHAFPYVVQVGRYYSIGSNEPIDFNLEAVARRLRQTSISSYVTSAGTDPIAIVNALRGERIWFWKPGDPRPTDFDTDLFPKDEFYLNRWKLDLFSTTTAVPPAS